MYLIFAAIILSGCLSSALVWYGDSGYQGQHTFALVAGLLGAVATLICIVMYAFIVWEWFAAEHKSQIINREYGTNYTQEEVFFASDVIETVRQFDRKRYEINGDLMRGKDDKP